MKIYNSLIYIYIYEMNLFFQRNSLNNIYDKQLLMNIIKNIKYIYINGYVL